MADPVVRVVAIVPALDEEGTIGRVVRDCLEHVDVVVVVDDGSTDRTREFALAEGAVCISHATNVGVGAAVATGLAHALHLGARVAVQVDGDGQHVASGIPDLVAVVLGGADLVIGTRFETGFEMGWVRRTALRGFSAAVSWRLGTVISDPTSGFRAFGPNAMHTLGPVFPRTYLADTVEVLYLAADRDLNVQAVPVVMIARLDGRPYAGPVRSVLYALRMVLITGKHLRRRRVAPQRST